MNAPKKITIDIVSDVMCPWCMVGMLRLERALDMLEGEVEATVMWRPFELNPDLGPEGRNWAQGILEKYGREIDPDEPTQTEIAAADLGYEMRYLGPLDENGEKPERRSWNTLNAHKLMHWMLERHGAEAQNRLSRALFDAHFQYRRNVSDKATLIVIAQEAGLQTDGAMEAMDDLQLSKLIHAEERSARDNGINSVPTFIVNGRFGLPGAREPETVMHYIRKAVEQSAETGTSG